MLRTIKFMHLKCMFQWLLLFTAASSAKLLQSCPTLCDPIDGSPPGSPIPGILQARTLEWVAISFSIYYLQSCLISQRTSSNAK